MRIPFLAVAALFVFSLSASATPVTYDLTLTGSPYNGMGSIILDSAPSPTGLTSYTAGEYSGLQFTIDGETFTAPPGAVSAVEFLDGSYYDITFAQTVGNFTLDTTSGFNLYYPGGSESGKITSALAPAAVTPEPSSIALLGTGLLGVVGVVRKRFA